jgi:hypothetical protein
MGESGSGGYEGETSDIYPIERAGYERGELEDLEKNGDERDAPEPEFRTGSPFSLPHRLDGGEVVEEPESIGGHVPDEVERSRRC